MSKQHDVKTLDDTTRHVLATLEFAKIVSHLTDCEKTGPSLARMVTDPEHGKAYIELLCTSLVALQGLISKLRLEGNDEVAEVPEAALLSFMERLGNEHGGPDDIAADLSVVH